VIYIRKPLPASHVLVISHRERVCDQVSKRLLIRINIYRSQQGSCRYPERITSNSKMTRTKHRAHPTPSFPVSCLGFTDDTTLLLGGGGGPSRTGIKNKLVSQDLVELRRRRPVLNVCPSSCRKYAQLLWTAEHCRKSPNTSLSQAKICRRLWPSTSRCV
jgi:hypothetical protein